MCGRFVAASPRDLLVDWFGIEDTDDELAPSYNVAPTDDVYTVAADEGHRVLRVVSWGLVAGEGDTPLINARAETLGERPAFREAFLHQRCLVPADGFFEWETLPGGSKQPYLFAPADGRPVGFAGICGRRETCAIVTSAAVEPVSQLHDRMPVIVPPDRWGDWLDPFAEAEELHALLLPPQEAPLVVRPVSPRVNDVRNNDPALLDAAPPPPRPLRLL